VATLEPLRRIADGTPVDASTTNQVVDDVESRLNYLYDLFRLASAGRSLILVDVVVSPDAVLKGPVYFDAAANRFEPAIAQVVPSTDGVVPAPQTRHYGLLRRKTGADRGDVLIGGYDELNVSDAILGADKSPGVLYMSPAIPGRLTREAAFPSVPVCQWDGVGVLVRPFRDDEFAGRHEHLEFDLACIPAGVTHPPAMGARHVITSPNAAIEGWLPATHASFSGNAPDGAAFGYNLAANERLASLWPPVPLASAALLLDRGEARENGYSFVPQGMTGLVVLDANGIWWLSDCHNDAPWPATYDSAVSEPPLSEGYAECPRQLSMRMKLLFCRQSYATGVGVVTSLQTDDPRILITCNGEPSAVGPLRIKLDLSAGVADETSNTAKALKAINADGTFERGNVVAALIAGSSNVLIASTATVPAVGDTPAKHSGEVMITVIPAEELFLPVNLYKHQNTAEDYPKGVMMPVLRKLQDGTIVGRVDVPMGLTASLSLKFRLWLCGFAAGTLPAMSMTRRRVPRPSGSTALPTADSALAVTTNVAVANAYDYIEIDSAAFTVQAGDSVLFKLIRLQTDGYNADVGIVKALGVLAAA
jgi:hypothetical protein